MGLCSECSGPLPPHEKGRPRLTCSNACKQARYRRRDQAIASGLERAKFLGIPTLPPASQAERRADIVGAALEDLAGRPAGDPTSRLAAAIAEIQALAFELRGLEPELAPALAAIAGGLADALVRALRQHAAAAIEVGD